MSTTESENATPVLETVQTKIRRKPGKKPTDAKRAARTKEAAGKSEKQRCPLMFTKASLSEQRAWVSRREFSGRAHQEWASAFPNRLIRTA